MRPAHPPAAASWMLEHLIPGVSNEALAGDLHEEFRAGRSRRWYWRQVLGAISIRCARELLAHQTVLLFAVLWSMLAPAWLLAVAGLEARMHLSERLAGMDWPWSIVLDLGSLLATNLIFLWAGILLYLLPDLWIAGALRFRALSSGIRASLPAVIVVWVALIVLPKHFLAVSAPEIRAATGVAGASLVRTPTPREAVRIEDQNIWAAYDRQLAAEHDEIRSRTTVAPEPVPHEALLDLRMVTQAARIPFFLVILCTLWSVAQRQEGRSRSKV
ncbi:MAG TPA: hypothetical protein VGF96_18670 [Terracidiphilus sp.]